MSALFVTNAFSISMLPPGMDFAACTFDRLDDDELREVIAEDFQSAIGHADTAAVVSTLLGKEVAANRINVVLEVGDCALVAQYTGPRMAEGTHTLPEGASIVFWLVRVLDPTR